MYAIGYDLGSSFIKAALVEVESGKSISTIQKPNIEMSINAPKEAWAEQNPDIWWANICAATKELLEQNKINPIDIVSIGIAYQMHGLVIVDKACKPIRDAIIWCDSRAVEIGNEALENIGVDKCAKHLLNSPANFTASKLKWVLDNEPENFEQIHKVLLPGDYIAYKLTGELQTTISGLSEMILWDFKDQTIAKWLLDYYKVPETILPDVVETFSVQSNVSDKGAQESGLVEGTNLCYRAGDQPNNALSLNVFNSGEVAATGGTSGVVYAVTDKISGEELTRINTFAHVNYSTENPVCGKLLNINGAGIQYRWLKENLKIDNYHEMNELALKAPVGSEGLIIFPYGNGAERMFNNKTLHSHIKNINFNIHSNTHLCRASLESIAFSYAYGIEILRKDKVEIKVLRVGNDNLFQSEVFATTLSTLIDFPIEVYDTTGAVGAARASTVAHGKSLSDFSEIITKQDYLKTYKPDSNSSAYVEAYENWKKELEIIKKNN